MCFINVFLNFDLFFFFQAEDGIRDVAVTGVQTCALRLISRWGTPSLLVGSAGVASVSPLLDIAVDDWDKVFEVNVKGILLSIQAVARAMIAAGLDGAMVAVSSINGIL